MYTSHGHNIPGMLADPSKKPDRILRCGGPSICAACAMETAEALASQDAELLIREPVDEFFHIKMKALNTVRNLINKTHDSVDWENNTLYVLWMNNVLQHWKVQVHTTFDDGRYYEVTYNGTNLEIYVDVFVKVDTRRITKEEMQGPLTSDDNSN